MTWTYDNAPSTTSASGRRDAVRYLIGDTDSEVTPTLSDEEIAFSFVNEGSVSAGEVHARLQSTMSVLQADAAKAAAPIFGGQSIAANRQLDALSDVPQPTFLRDQDGYPGVRSSP